MSYDSQAQEGTETAAHSDDQQTKRGSAWHARAQATKQTGEQTRILRSRLLGRMVLLLLAWSACFSLLCVLFEFSLSDSIGERVADATSTWIYSSLPTEKSLLDAEKNSTVETNDNEDTSEVTRDPWAALGFADEKFMARYDDLASQIGPENVQLMVAADGRLAMREAIFERFYREDRSRGQSANAGLGLAIAREIVEAHGGTIGAESSNGLTTFTIRLPR